MTAVEGEEPFLPPSRRGRLCAYRARTRLPLGPASRFSSLQGRNCLHAGGFRSRPFVASSSWGLLIPRSQVRILPGPHRPVDQNPGCGGGIRLFTGEWASRSCQQRSEVTGRNARGRHTYRHTRRSGAASSLGLVNRSSSRGVSTQSLVHETLRKASTVIRRKGEWHDFRRTTDLPLSGACGRCGTGADRTCLCDRGGFDGRRGADRTPRRGGDNRRHWGRRPDRRHGRARRHRRTRRSRPDSRSRR